MVILVTTRIARSEGRPDHAAQFVTPEAINFMADARGAG